MSQKHLGDALHHGFLGPRDMFCTGPAGVGALRDHPADSLVAPGTHAGLQPHREGLSGLRAHALYGAQAERA